MNDGRYTDQELEKIVAAAHGLTPTLRDTLESAARHYLDEMLTRQRMAGPVDKRDRWLEIEKNASQLLRSIEAIDDWIPPIWGSDGEPDHQGQRADIVLRLREIVRMAGANAADYDESAKKFARKQNPAREQLYRRILEVWTDDLGRDPTYSPTGPVVRFFNAVLEPVLGHETPKPSTIGDFLDREAKRRAEDLQTLGPTVNLRIT